MNSTVRIAAVNAASPPDERNDAPSPTNPEPESTQSIPRSVDTLRGTLFFTGTGQRGEMVSGMPSLAPELVTVQASWRSRPAHVALPADWRTLLDDTLADLVYQRPELRGYLSGAEFSAEQIVALEEYSTMLESDYATVAMQQRNAAEATWARWLARRIRDRTEWRAADPFTVKDARHLMDVVTSMTSEANKALAMPRPRAKARAQAHRQLSVAKLLLDTALAIEADLVE